MKTKYFLVGLVIVWLLLHLTSQEIVDSKPLITVEIVDEIVEKERNETPIVAEKLAEEKTKKFEKKKKQVKKSEQKIIHKASSSIVSSINSAKPPKIITVGDYRFNKRGKVVNPPSFKSLYTLTMPSTKLRKGLSRLEANPNLMQGLQQQSRFLKRKRNKGTKKLGGLNISQRQLSQTVRQLQEWLQRHHQPFAELFELHQIKGKDGHGNVQFTGYYTPVIKAQRYPSGAYQYPLYQKPRSWGQNSAPTRQEIDEYKVLANRGLELAWTNSLWENYQMHIQGSGYVEYPDGTLELLMFGGHNGYRFQGIELPTSVYNTGIAQQKDLNRNRSYTFFKKGKKAKKPTGSTGTTLAADYSIAVDPRYIPYGSCLLALIPITDKRGKLIRHELRIVLAQDKGGAIKGAGHVDLYCGAGEAAKKKATATNHYGPMWLLVAKN